MPAKPIEVAEIAARAVPAAGHATSLLATGSRAGVVIASACTHASVAANKALPSRLNSSQRIGCRPMPNAALRVASRRGEQRDRAARIAHGEPAAVGREGQRRYVGTESHARALARRSRPVQERRCRSSSPTAIDAPSGAKANAVTAPSAAQLCQHAAIGHGGDADHALGGARDGAAIVAQCHQGHGALRRLHDGGRRRAGCGVPDAHDAVAATGRREIRGRRSTPRP